MPPHIEISGSLGANPQLGLWLPIMSLNVKKEPGPLCPSFLVEKVGERLLPPGSELRGWQTALPPASLSAPQGQLWLAGAGPQVSDCGVTLLGEDMSFGRRRAVQSQCSRSPDSRVPVSLKEIPHRYTGSAYVSRLPSCKTRVLAMLEGGDSRVHIWTSPKMKSILGCSQQLRSLCGSLSPDFTSSSYSNQSLGGGEGNCNT